VVEVDKVAVEERVVLVVYQYLHLNLLQAELVITVP
jgi:hypothetical protein